MAKKYNITYALNSNNQPIYSGLVIGYDSRFLTILIADSNRVLRTFILHQDHIISANPAIDDATAVTMYTLYETDRSKYRSDESFYIEYRIGTVLLTPEEVEYNEQYKSNAVFKTEEDAVGALREIRCHGGCPPYYIDSKGVQRDLASDARVEQVIRKEGMPWDYRSGESWTF